MLPLHQHQQMLLQQQHKRKQEQVAVRKTRTGTDLLSASEGGAEPLPPSFVLAYCAQHEQQQHDKQ